ncbi:MAG: (S)-benzoin forming benzil reductase [Bacillota bacterium]
MNYYIITGSSRGLGEAIARNLISKESCLFCISRKRNEELIKQAVEKCCSIDYFEKDFTEPQSIKDLMDDIFSKIDSSKAERIYLFNNAGVLNPIKPVEKCITEEIIDNANVNLIAPIILTSGFIRNVKNYLCDKKIINISSGAARNPYYGWSCYCSSKAGLDMFTRTVGIEQTSGKNPTLIVSVAPGIVDTDMQKTIRECKVEDFEQIEKFIRYKKEGKLQSPEVVAQKIIEMAKSRELSQGRIYDIRDFM